MNVIPFDGKYIDSLIELWNQELYADSMNVETFSALVLGDVNFNKNLVLLAVEDDKLCGFIWAVKRRYPYLERGLEPHRGYVVAQAVHSDYQRRGIGKTLLKTVEDTMTKDDAQEITIGAYSPNYLFPGVDKKHYEKAISFYQSQGYDVKGEAVSMHQTLIDFVYPESTRMHKLKLEEMGYTFSKFKYSDSIDLLDFLMENFGSGWTSNVQESLKRHSAKDTLIICRNSANEIVGYCQRAIDGHDDRFGPFGVNESLRGLGIGGVLFDEMLYSMVKKGIHHVYFLWTGGRAQAMYERHGMKVYRSYSLMKKEL